MVALLVMFAWASTPLGAFVERVCCGMWLHELGHASASWLCGVMAVPLPWVTSSGEQRSPGLVVLLAGALALWAAALRRGSPERATWAAPAAGSVLVLLASTVPSLGAVNSFIIFAGDGGAMVFGAALLMASLSPDDSPLSRGGLRWGYLVIGAASFCDAAHTWVQARRDPADLPFGLEAGMPSDATRLVETYGWPEARLITAYLWLAALCLSCVLGWAGWSLRRAK